MKIIVLLLLVLGLGSLEASEPSAAETAEKFKSLTKKMRSKYLEMDSYIDTLLVATLMEQHVLAFGGPGGSKTQTAKDILNALQGKSFALQFSPATKQEMIVGALKGKKYLEEGTLEYVLDQSLLMHQYAILDEIDKANPDVLASLLSVLNERRVMLGDKEIKGELRTALITSNMTLNDFLEKFAATNDRPTGQALLDRVMFKVLVVNRLSSIRNLSKLLNRTSEATPWPTEIELRQLRKEIDKITVPQEVEQLALHLWMRLAQVLEAEQKKQSDECAEDPTSMRYPYTMSNQFSTRGVTNLLNILKVGKFLEAQRGEQSFNPAELTLTPEDILFAQAFMIMQGPGNLRNGEQLESVRAQFASDPRTLKMIDDLKFERTSFLNSYQEVLKLYQSELVDLAGDSLISHGLLQGDLSTLAPQEKQAILEKILQIESKIQARRAKAAAAGDSEDIESVAGVARSKVLREMADLRALLKSEDAVTQSAQKANQRVQAAEEARQEEVKKLHQEQVEDAVKTITGATYQRYDRPHSLLGKNAVKDPRGLIWGDVVQTTQSYEEAANYCAQLSRDQIHCRLPKLDEFQSLNGDRADTIVPNLKNKNFWALPKTVPYSSTPVNTCGFSGGIFSYPSSLGQLAFRCVCDA